MSRSRVVSLLLVTLAMACGDDDAVAGGAYCDPVAQFDGQVAQDEREVLRLINEHRAAGAQCGAQGTFEATDPLVMDPHLRCAARVHSLDMAERGYFSHVSPEGEGPSERITAAGYESRGWGENIARGSSAQRVVERWMQSDGHCANIMSPGFEDIGVGRVDDLWTLVFARPRR